MYLQSFWVNFCSCRLTDLIVDLLLLKCFGNAFFIKKNVIFDTFGIRLIIYYIINPICSSFLSLSIIFTSEHDTDE